MRRRNALDSRLWVGGWVGGWLRRRLFGRLMDGWVLGSWVVFLFFLPLGSSRIVTTFWISFTHPLLLPLSTGEVAGWVGGGLTARVFRQVGGWVGGWEDLPLGSSRIVTTFWISFTHPPASSAEETRMV